MNFRKKPSYSARDLGILSLIALVTIILGSVLVGANIALSRVIHGGGGFFIGMEGARAFLFEHTGPYSGTVASLTQELAYGRTANNGENPYVLTIPFFLVPVYFPFTLFTESASARGLWMFISEASLVGTAFLALRLIDWQPRRLFVIFFFLTSIFSYYSVVGLLEGTPVIQLALLYFGFLLAYYAGRDELAGALLVFTLFYWQVGSLLLILAIGKIFSDKRWRVLFGFGMTFNNPIDAFAIALSRLDLLIHSRTILSIPLAILDHIWSDFCATLTGAWESDCAGSHDPHHFGSVVRMDDSTQRGFSPLRLGCLSYSGCHTTDRFPHSNQRSCGSISRLDPHFCGDCRPLEDRILVNQSTAGNCIACPMGLFCPMVCPGYPTF